MPLGRAQGGPPRPRRCPGRPGSKIAVRYRWSRITCRFVGSPQKDKTRFIISYTAQNRFPQCSLKDVLALLAPGQGSQTPGMLASWLELPGAADRISTWSQSSGLDLARLGTTATAEEITDTAVTQPLVVAATLLAWEELTKRGLLAGRGFHRGRPLRRRDRRIRDRRRDLQRRRGGAGRHPRRRDGQGVRDRAHRHVRGARRRRGRGAEPPRGAGPGARPTATRRARSWRRAAWPH